MKKIILTSLCAVGLVSSAFAGSLGDLVMGFRDDGSAGGSGTTTNVTFDLGSYTQYLTGGAYATGGTVDTGLNVSSLLGTTYGSGFMNDTGLFWGVAGTNGNTPTTRTLYVSANPATPVSATFPYLSRTSASQAFQASKFVTLATNVAASGGSMTATSASVSWSALETTVLAFGAYPANEFESVTGAGLAALYVNAPSTVPTPATRLGTFSISAANGDVLYTAIPEPSVYGGFLGTAALGFAALRRRKQALVA